MAHSPWHAVLFPLLNREISVALKANEEWGTLKRVDEYILVLQRPARLGEAVHAPGEPSPTLEIVIGLPSVQSVTYLERDKV